MATTSTNNEPCWNCGSTDNSDDLLRCAACGGQRLPQLMPTGKEPTTMSKQASDILVEMISHALIEDNEQGNNTKQHDIAIYLRPPNRLVIRLNHEYLTVIVAPTNSQIEAKLSRQEPDLYSPNKTGRKVA